MGDLLDRDVLRERLARVLPEKNPLLDAMGGRAFDLEALVDQALGWGERLAPTSPTRPGWSRPRWRAASTCCSRARRARCSTSTTAPTRS